MDDWTLTSVAPFNSTGLDDNINDNSSIRYDSYLNIRLFRALEITFNILDALIGCTANSLLLLVILSSGSLRADMRNVLIVNLATADLLVDVVIAPIMVDSLLRKNWIHGCFAHLLIQFLYVIAFSFLSMWGMITIDVLLLVRVARTSPLTSLVTFSLSPAPALWRRRLKLALKIVVVALLWLLAIVSTVPLAVVGNEEFWDNLQLEAETICFIPMNLRNRNLYNVFFFILPISILSVLFVGIGAICLYRRHITRVRSSFPTSHLQTTITDMASVSTTASGIAAAATPPSAEAAAAAGTRTATTTTRCRDMESNQEPMGPYLVATIVTMVMMGGKPLVLMYYNEVHFTTFVVISNLADLKSTVLPFVWLLMMSDLKDQARRLLKSWRNTLLRVKPASPTEMSVTYTTLSDN